MDQFTFVLFSKRTLLLNNLPAMVGSLMMFFSYHAKAPSLLVIGRLVVGFNGGKFISNIGVLIVK